MDYEDKDPFSWTDKPLADSKLSIYWSDEEAVYRYQYDGPTGMTRGDASWAIRMAKHYKIPMPNVPLDITTKRKSLGKRPLGGKK